MSTMMNPEFDGVEALSGLDFKTMDFSEIKKGLERANVIVSRAPSVVSEAASSSEESSDESSDDSSEEALCKHGKNGDCKRCDAKAQKSSITLIQRPDDSTRRLFIPPRHKSKGNKTYSNYIYGNDVNYMKAIESKIRRYRALKAEAIQISIDIAEEQDDINIDSDISDIEAATVRLETILSQSDMHNNVNMVCDLLGTFVEKTFDGKRNMPIINRKMNLTGAKRVLREKFSTIGPEITEVKHQFESKVGKSGSLVFQLIAAMASLAIKNAEEN